MSTVPNRFSFEYFESLSGTTIIPAAQKFTDEHFPAGSDLNAVLAEFKNASARCAKRMYRGNAYYECDYNLSAGILRPFTTIEWKIIITADKNEERVERISVNRGLTGL